MPAVIRQFRAEHKEISVDLRVGPVEEVFRAVREGRVDVAFTSRRDSSDLGWLPLKDDPLLAVLPLDYDVQGADSFPMEAFSGRDFFLPAMGFEVDILPPLSRRGVTPNIQNVQVGDSAVISLVEQGLGLSILSELVLTGRRDAVQALPLSPPAARELGIAYRGNEPLSPLTRQFMRLAREIIQNL